MGWWPFRRTPGGRHAFGPAVTSLPTGPLVLPVPATGAADPSSTGAPAAPAPQSLLPLDPDLGPSEQLEALLTLLGDGGVPAPAVGALDDVPGGSPLALRASPAGGPSPGEPVTDAPQIPVAPAAAYPLPVVAAPFVATPAAAEAAPLERRFTLPAPAPEPFVPSEVPLAAPGGPRVELGFRDGSTTSLQPGSEQALALEDLARLLTSG